MARVYTFSVVASSVSVAQDLMAIYTGARSFKLHWITIGQTTAASVGNLPISIKRIGGTLTNGSGGTTPTGVPVEPNDAAATVTAHANDTTQASGTTTVVLARDGYNVVNGYLFQPPESDRPVFAPGEICVLSLDSGVSPAQNTLITLCGEEGF